MTVFKCKMCGGDLAIQENATICECEFCGTKQTVPTAKTEALANLFNRANKLRLKCEFDKAEEIYEKILGKDETLAEAHWGLVLCKYGIEYVEDPATETRVPTCHRTSYESVTSDSDYLSAVEYADSEQKKIYRAEAKAIEQIQKRTLEIVKNEKPFDVFICYKETDKKGKRTVDSTYANDIYHQLTNEGFKVFYAAITLEDKLGQEYEPYIFAALNSAKVMLVIGSKEEYFNAVWVKNEWSRFLKLMKTDRSKLLIPCYKDIDPYDLPEEFAHLQAQDMGKIGFVQDLLRGIKKVVKEDKKETVKTEVKVRGKSPADSFVDRAFLYIEDGDNEKAEELLNHAIEVEPKHPGIYVAKLLIELGLKKQTELGNLQVSFAESQNYERAVRFADSELKSELQGYLAAVKSNMVKAVYQEAIEMINSAKSEKAFLEAKEKLLTIAEYVDVSKYTTICDERAEIMRKEAIYQTALKSLKNPAFNKVSLENAIKGFTSIKEYKDSESKIIECKSRIENGLKELEKQKKKKQKTALIVTPILLIIIGIVIYYVTAVVPKNNYATAEELFNNKSYIEAYHLFIKANIEDSQEKAKECLYQQALRYLEEENQDAANQLLEEITGYKDSSDLIHYHEYKVYDSKEAKCEKEGYNKYKCACGHKYEEIIQALGHNLTQATCTEGSKCTRCGAKGQGALGHTNGAICERCGKSTFEPITFTGSGEKVIKNINLPAGKYTIKTTYRSTEYSNFWAEIFSSTSDEYGDMIANEVGTNCSSEVSFSGPVNNGYIEVHWGDGNWTITIEAF